MRPNLFGAGDQSTSWGNVVIDLRKEFTTSSVLGQHYSLLCPCQFLQGAWELTLPSNRKHILFITEMVIFYHQHKELALDMSNIHLNKL